jgi:precorrin-6Y C5,15-methyltransferase (decarboxylating)
MLDYGYTFYIMHVGEHLGNPEKERITTLTLEEAASLTFAMPNCIILHTNDHSLNTNKMHDHSCATQGHVWSIPNHSCSTQGHAWSIPGHSCSTLGHSCFNHPPCRVFGIPDHAFALLDGREKMITKMPIRLLTLQALDLPNRHVLWDIGACTGSVSIEARLLFPHLRIEAFEIRPECEAIIQENCRRHGTPGITLHIGDFLKANLPPLNVPSNTPPSSVPSNTLSLSVGCGTAAASSTSPLPLPDAVFIGGHGGHLKAIMAKVAALLAPGGIIVMNSVKAPLVKTDSHKLWNEACAELGLTQAPSLHIQLNDYHPIDILKAVKPSSPPL